MPLAPVTKSIARRTEGVMRDTTCILFPGTVWRVGILRGGDMTITEAAAPGEDVKPELARQVARVLLDAGCAGEGALLALPSSWCFAASISTADLPRNDTRAMLYRLEEKLPIAAESVVAGFIPAWGGHREAEASGRALGVCARLDLVRPILDALESAGVMVRCIAPAAMLAVQAIPDRSHENPSILLLGDGDTERPAVSVIAFEHGSPSTWAAVGARVSDIKLTLDLLEMESGKSPAIEAIGIDGDLQAALARSTGRPITMQPGSICRLAAQAAVDISAGRIRPWIDLHQGPLAIPDAWLAYRKPLNVFLASALAMLLAAVGVMSFRAIEYEGLRRASEQQMSAAFRARFPGWAVPANVRTVVASEHRKLAAARGSSLPTEASRSALHTLRDVLGGLAPDSRFTLGRMTIEDAAFEIEGRVRSYEDVDSIAAATRNSGMEVPPPQTRKDNDGSWSFTLRGTRAVKSAAPGGG
jgi:hypothetical protein